MKGSYAGGKIRLSTVMLGGMNPMLGMLIG